MEKFKGAAEPEADLPEDTSKVSPEFLPQDKKRENMLDDMRERAWDKVVGHIGRRDAKGAEQARREFNHAMVEMGEAKTEIPELAELEKDLEDEAGRKNREAILRADRMAADIHKFLATQAESEGPSWEQLKKESEEETRKVQEKENSKEEGNRK